jgi:hypothetical protein
MHELDLIGDPIVSRLGGQGRMAEDRAHRPGAVQQIYRQTPVPKAAFRDRLSVALDRPEPDSNDTPDAYGFAL